MIGYLDFLFLSYQGRIGRLALWLGMFGLGLAQFGAIGFLLHLSHGSSDDLLAFYHGRVLSQQVMVHVIWPAMIVVALGLYPTYALYTKRWHDRGKSGWWSLIGLIPFVGFWMVIELGFLGGDEYQNEYGTR